MFNARTLLALALTCASAAAGEIRLGDAPRVMAPVVAPANPAQVAPRALTVDSTNRAAVVAFFNANYTPAPAIGWTGSSTAPYDPGTISSAYQDATLLRVNFYRAMAGLPATVVFDSALNAKCQQTALMMSVAGMLNHSPPSASTAAWPYATPDGAEGAGNSNLSLGSSGPDAMDGLMADPGSNNGEAGHRRWILYPPQVTMGHGAVPKSGSLYAADALWVLAPFGSRPPTPATVPWPNAGYLPYPLLPFDYSQSFAKIPGRWTFAMPNADFSAATVTMTSSGSNVSVQLETLVNGYGDNTLVWHANGVPLGKPAADTQYDVVIANVIPKGGSATTFNYSVIVFDPATAGTGPVANAQTLFTLENTPLPITLTGKNGTTFAIATQPAQGALSGFDATTGAVTYTPANGYTGADSFTFTVAGGGTVSAPATVSITVGASGDVYPPELLAYLNTNNLPVNATPATTSAPQTKTTLSINLNFKTGIDGLTFVTPLTLPASFTLAGRNVIADIGGVLRPYTLDASGQAKSDVTSKLTVKGKLKNGVTTAAGAAIFTVKLSKSDLHTTLAAAGLKDDQVYSHVKIPIPVTLLIVDAQASTLLHGVLMVDYSATPGKTGKAKAAL